MKVNIKAFILPHIDSSILSCQDYYAVNPETKAVAVADGVTRSLLGSFMSKALASDYVRDPKCLFYRNGEGVVLSKDYTTEFSEFYKEVYEKRNELGREMLELYREEECDFSASTFAGCYFDEVEKLWKFVVLGDSCVFFIDKDLKNTFSIPSMQADNFDNQPHYFSSNGSHKGSALYREMDLQDGYLLLMTDAIASWFAKNKEDATAVKTFLSFESHEEFKKWRDETILSNKMSDDDTTLLILEIKGSDNRDCQFNILHCDDTKYSSTENDNNSSYSTDKDPLKENETSNTTKESNQSGEVQTTEPTLSEINEKIEQCLALLTELTKIIESSRRKKFKVKCENIIKNIEGLFKKE